MKNIITFLLILCSLLIQAQNYIPDPFFGGTGSIVTNYNMYYDNDQAPKSVLYNNNVYIFSQKTQLSSFNYNGTVNENFGTSGLSRIIIPDCPTYTITIHNSKIINDSILVFGKCYNPSTSVFYGFIVKMSINGVIDNSFGNNGIVIINIGNLNNDVYSDGITDIVYKNGNYFALGTMTYLDTNSIHRKNVFTVKLNSNGIINLTYDSTGLKKLNTIDGHKAKKIYVHQGNLLIIGHVTNNNSGYENSICLVKINDNGNLVSSFGIDGIHKIVLSPSGWQTGESFENCDLVNDDLYLFRNHFIYSFITNKIQRTSLLNLTTTDVLVTNNNTITKVLIDNDKIYQLGCFSNTCPENFNIIRRNIDGSLDNTFNQTGTYSFNFPQPNSWTNTLDTASVIIKDTNNGILVGGYTSAQFYTAAPYKGFAMLRIVDETLSTNYNNVKNIILSPNPVKNIVNIENPDGITIDSIQIFDISGKIVLSMSNVVEKINLETLMDGFYTVKITSEENSSNFKIIKKN